jgi:hypothetical protein
MTFANHFKIERGADHCIVKFYARTPGMKDDGDLVSSIALPLSISVELLLALFENMVYALPEMQVIFTGFQTRLTDLNKLAGNAPRPPQSKKEK